MKSFDKKIFKELIKTERPLILDIGCYDGSDTIEFANLFENSTIYCFDADPRSVKLFKKNVNLQNVKLFEFILSNVDGYLEWNCSTSKTRRHNNSENDWSASSSIKMPKNHLTLFNDVSFFSGDKIESKRLDTFYNNEVDNKRRIDIMWADVNGAEGELFMGAEKILNIIDYIFVEFSNVELYENQFDLDSIKKILNNFTLLDIYDYYGNFGNALFKNNNI
jgi:FkbM family methyltransferase